MDTKKSGEAAVQDRIGRYVYQVSRRLPGRARGEIEAELRGLIEDMLETRCGDTAPTREDLDLVLTELGSPTAFAAQYGGVEGRPRYLIGPAVFPQYLDMLRLVLLAVTVGMVVVSILQSLAAPAASGFALVGTWLGNIVSGLFSAAAAVTLLFAVLEWRGVRMETLDADWLDALPPVPREESRFSRGECIGGLVVSLLALLLLVSAPRYIGALLEGTAIPMFDMALYRRFLPLLAACCVLGACKEIAKLLEGRYTMRLAIAVTVADLLSIALFLFVLAQPVWNRSLLLLADGAGTDVLSRFWDATGQVFLGAAILGHAGDLISLWIHTLRAVRAE